MVSKRLLRQIKKSFGEDEYHLTLSKFINENLSNFTDIQKDKIEPLSNFEEFINVIEQAYNDDQSLLIRAEKNLETSSAELAQMNKDLFKTNKIIEQMLNSLDQGFVIFDKELRCLSLYTKATIEILALEVEGKLVQDILPFEKEESKSSFVDWCGLVFLDIHEFDNLQALAPKRLCDKKTGKIMDLDFKTVRDADNVLLYMTLILTDRTQEIITQNNANKMQEYAQMVAKVIADKKTTHDNIHQIQRLFCELKDVLLKEEINDDEFVVIKRLLHTIKGAGSAYFFGELGRRINEIELRLNDIIDKKDILKLLKHEEGALVLLFEEYLKQVSELISEDKNSMNLSERNKDWILDLMLKNKDQSFSKDQILDDLYNQFILCPIHDYICPYEATLTDLAKYLGKPIPQFKMTGENIRIHYEECADFLSSLIHIYTNIMDHGLENEEGRVKQGKPIAGKILTRTEMIIDNNGVNNLQIVISDDGNGIDPKKIKSKLTRMEEWKNRADELTDDELVNFVFYHGFSTAEKKSNISGQGMGLDAVKAAVEKIGGIIEVFSKINEGVVFTIILPLKGKNNRFYFVNERNINE